jgi:EpsI family protein
MNRRDLLAGLGCAAALGSAEWLRPRDKLTLMSEGTKLTDIIPSGVGPWSAGDGGDIVIPRTEGSLAARLYSDQLARLYRDREGTAPDIMVLIAYGEAQSDILQLHRPEVCYPAIGFEIVERHFVDIPLDGGKVVPAVALTAKAGPRVEDIVYWTRLGDALPRTQGEQRIDRFRAALAGYVGDGVLARASAVRTSGSGKPLTGDLLAFMEALVRSLKPAGRVALLGRPLSASQA